MVLRFRPESSKKVVFGEVAEWLKAAVLKTVERLRVPGVRIPPSPPLRLNIVKRYSIKFSLCLINELIADLVFCFPTLELIANIFDKLR